MKGGRSSIDGYVLLPKLLRGRLLDMNVCSGEVGGMSDHFFGENSTESGGRMEGVRNVLKVSELNKSVKEHAYQESLRGKYEVLRGGDVESVEAE